MTHQPQQKQCFTIGYGDYPIDRFITFLQNISIDVIIDVRSSPYSRFNPHFNREYLEKSLNRSEIGYRYMGDKIGGRYTDPGLLFPDGTVNYRKVQNTEKFQEGINEVLSIISSGKKIALMCVEKEPERCHRFALISPVLQLKGISIIHIRPDMKLQANEDLERERVDSFFDTSQVSITGEPVDFVALMYDKVGRGPKVP
ncbi:MAG: DUF488 domain-containing protein [Methanoregula sp.]|nr:DUF488 domain-containing protein [Methanoregula sp.]